MSETTDLSSELPASPGRIALFAVSAVALGLGLAYWLEYPRGPVCHAILTARTSYVVAPCAGTIEEWTVSEGMPVKIGDQLLRIQDQTLQRQIVDKKRQIVGFEIELQKALASAELELKWRERALESEICDIQLRSASYLKEKYNFELQRSMLNDILAGREFVIVEEADTLFQSLIIDKKTQSSQRMATVLEMELAANAAEVSAAQVEICELRQQQLTALKDALPQQVRRTQGVDVAEANLDRAKGELEQLLAEESELIINSPSMGRVGVFQCRVGDHLKPGMPIVELLDDAQRYLMVYVPSRQIPHFEIGKRVTLLFPGDQTCLGVVSSVAPQAKTCPNTTSAIGSTFSDSTVLVQVEQVGQVWPSVPVGSQVLVRPEKNSRQNKSE